MGDHTLLTETFFNRKIYLDSRDISLTPHIAYEGRWEPWVTDLLVREIKMGDTFVDVGANCGFFSLLAAHLVGGEGFVLAVEPQSRLAELLRKSLSINGFDPVATVVQAAVGAEEGLAELNRHDFYMGSASLLPGGGAGDAGTEAVSVKALPAIISWAEEASGSAIRPNIIKVDIEGYEYSFWRGAREYLAALETLTVIMEFSPDRYLAQGIDPKAFTEELLAAGFAISRLHTDNSETEYGPSNVEQTIASGDYADIILRKGAG